VPDVALPETEQVSRDLDRSGQSFLRSKVVTPKYIERALKTRTQNENTGMNDGPAPYISNPTQIFPTLNSKEGRNTLQEIRIKIIETKYLPDLSCLKRNHKLLKYRSETHLHVISY
jgi:hypothetical protein